MLAGEIKREEDKSRKELGITTGANRNKLSPSNLPIPECDLGLHRQ